MFKGRIKTAYEKFLDLLYPTGLTCVNCGAELTADTRYGFCAKCTTEMPFITGRKCLICGTEILNEADYCDNCNRYDRYFDKCRAPLSYEGIAADLIKRLKFGNKRYIAIELAKMMCDTYIAENYAADLAVCVPMSAKEIKERGFNQSELLLMDVSKRLNLTAVDALVKITDTDKQKKLTAKERRENLKGAFAVKPNAALSGKSVLLIDDVFTTGATVNECARTLKKAGAKRVFVLTACITKFKPEGETAEITAS